MAKQSSSKFIKRNRPPRVHIEYEVDVGDSQEKVSLPMVFGVFSDLSGASADELAPVAERNFQEIDVDNFDARMKALKPSVKFTVPNSLTGEGNLPVELNFESMDDFTPAAIARKVGSLNSLLEARTQLSNLVTFMDGRTGAEELITKLLGDSELLQSLASAPKPADEASD